MAHTDGEWVSLRCGAGNFLQIGDKDVAGKSFSHQDPQPRRIAVSEYRSRQDLLHNNAPIMQGCSTNRSVHTFEMEEQESLMAKQAVSLLFLLLFGSLGADAQTNLEVGIFGHYFGFTPAKLGGVGLRGAFFVNRHLSLEGETAYDFIRTFREAVVDPTTGASSSVQSRLHAFHILGGAAYSVGAGPLRVFLAAKGGVVNINPSSPAPLVSTNSQINDIRAQHRNAVFYPGTGFEAYAGKWGFRLDVGDEMYFNHGANHNLRITFGPNYVF